MELDDKQLIDLYYCFYNDLEEINAKTKVTKVALLYAYDGGGFIASVDFKITFEPNHTDKYDLVFEDQYITIKNKDCYLDNSDKNLDEEEQTKLILDLYKKDVLEAIDEQTWTQNDFTSIKKVRRAKQLNKK
jgi:hypothetical protein